MEEAPICRPRRELGSLSSVSADHEALASVSHPGHIAIRRVQNDEGNTTFDQDLLGPTTAVMHSDWVTFGRLGQIEGNSNRPQSIRYQSSSDVCIQTHSDTQACVERRGERGCVWFQSLH